MDSEHGVITEGDIVSLFFLSQEPLSGLVPGLLLLEFLSLLLKPALDDVGHVH